MKKIFFGLFLLFTLSVTAQKTEYQADRLRAKMDFILKANRITDISLDTTFAAASDLKLPTQLAIKKYCDSKIGGRPYDKGVTPTTGYVLKWDGTKWAPAVDGGGGGGGVSLPIQQIGYGNSTSIVSDSNFVRVNNKVGINTGIPSRNLDVKGSIRGAIQDKGGAVFNVAAYGIFPDGTDQGAKVQALLDTIYAHNGGEMQFNTGTYKVNRRLKPKFTNTCLGKSPPIKITGAGAFMQGQSGPSVAYGGTIIDVQMTDTILFDLRGVGSTEFANIMFRDVSGGRKMFIRTTMNTLHVHDCSFYGDKSVNLCDDDAIVLGSYKRGIADGTCADGDTSINSGFQGYGTVIRDNFFNGIHRGVIGRTNANAIHIVNNTWWNNCGGESAILFGYGINNVDFGQNASQYIAGNLVEMVGYKYGFEMNNSTKNTIIGNQFYDHYPTCEWDIRLDTNSAFQFITLSIQNINTNKILYDASKQAVVLDPGQGQPSLLSQGLTTRRSNKYISNTGLGPITELLGGGQQHYISIASTSFSNWHKRSSGSPVNIFDAIDFGSGATGINFPGSAGYFDASGAMNLRGLGGEVWITSGAIRNHMFYSDGTLYGGMAGTTTTPFQMGSGQRLMWSGVTNTPISSPVAGFTSASSGIMRTIDGSSTDARHQALEFYATGTGSNTIPGGNTAARPSLSGSQYGFRYNTTIASPEFWNGSAWSNIGGGGTITGALTSNNIPKGNTSTSLQASQMNDDGTTVSIGTAATAAKFEINKSYTNTTDMNLCLSGNVPGLSYKTSTNRFATVAGYLANDQYTLLGNPTGGANPNTALMSWNANGDVNMDGTSFTLTNGRVNAVGAGSSFGASSAPAGVDYYVAIAGGQRYRIQTIAGLGYLDLWGPASGGNRNYSFASGYFASGDFNLLKSATAGGTPGDVILSVNSSNNVGIGTSGPGEKLDVDGNIKSSSLTSGGNRMVAATSAGVLYETTLDPANVNIVTLDDAYNNFAATPATIVVDNAQGQGNLTVNLTSTQDFAIQDNGTQFAIFDDSGNVGIGTGSSANQRTIINKTGSGTQVPLRVNNGIDEDASSTEFAIALAGVDRFQVVSSDPAGSYLNQTDLKTYNGSSMETAISFNGDYKGTKFENAIYKEIDNQTATTVTADGRTSIIYVPTSATTTAINLPEIVTGAIGSGQVGIGYELLITIHRSAVVTISRAGSSDLILVNDVNNVGGLSTSVATISNIGFVRRFTAVGADVWAVE